MLRDSELEVYALKIADELKKILLKHLEAANLDTISPDDIVIGKPYVDKNKEYCVDVSFNEEALFRPSLIPYEYPEGVPNIVLHLTHGWFARSLAFGYWESKDMPISSRKMYGGNDFMQNVADEFNKKFSKEDNEVTLSEEYRR
ncbi:MAG: hypothetical protein GX957_10550 [Clostridiaceae bacterium]|nr:hypothetical protein [Clostridiaceae bacterium]